MASPETRRVVLPRVPRDRPLRADDFAVEAVPLPEPQDGEVRIAVDHLAIDPGILVRLTGKAHYAATYVPGEAIPGRAVGTVEASRHPDFSAGDIVAAAPGWQERAVLAGDTLERWAFPDLPARLALGVLGIPGLTAWFGLRIAAPQAGETLLVSSAAGTVGSLAAQLGKRQGLRVAGTAGGAAKCAWLTDTLGLDAAIDHRAEPDLEAAIARACPGGLDVVFDNVGGAVLNAAIANANDGARVALSGAVAEIGLPPDQRMGLRDVTALITRNIRMEGFIVFRFTGEFAAARTAIADLVRSGELHCEEEIVPGLEAAPAAFLAHFTGRGIGRCLVAPR